MGSATFTTPNTGSPGEWQVPAGVNSVIMEAWGAGGVGGIRNGVGGGGGGGGAYSRSVVTAYPGQVFNYTVGAGGDIELSTTDGEASGVDNGSSYVVYAEGGIGATTSSGGDGGTVGSAIGDVTSSGGDGGNGYSTSDSSGGGGGAGYYSAPDAVDGGDGAMGVDASPDGGAGGDSVGSGGAGGIEGGDNWGMDAIDDEGGGGGGGGGANGGEGGHGATPGGGGGGGEVERFDTGYAARGGNGQVKISWTDPINILVNVISNA